LFHKKIFYLKCFLLFSSTNLLSKIFVFFFNNRSFIKNVCFLFQQQQRPDLSRLMQLQAAGAGLPGTMGGLPPALAAAAGQLLLTISRFHFI
jgi:hypothetical protein